MARILVGSIPVVGHINPLVPIVRALCARGHEVRWYTGAKYRSKVEATGARFVGLSHARDYDDAQIDREFPGRANLRGIAQLKFDMKHVFIDNAPGQLRDIQQIAQTFAPDVLFGEAGTFGGLFYSELSGVPLAVLGVIPIARSSIDTAPFGLGLAPNASALGRIRNRALNWAVEHVLFRDVQQHWNQTRKRLGLRPTGWWLNAGDLATVYLQPTIPSLEHPRSDLPDNVRFIGMIPADAPRDWVAPPFWHELYYPELLPKTSVMVTNGGYGGVQMALAHGVPLVVAGTSEDKPEVATRVACSGAGMNLKTAAPKPEQVRRAVDVLLHQLRYRERAQALAAEYTRYDAVTLAVEAVRLIAR